MKVKVNYGHRVSLVTCSATLAFAVACGGGGGSSSDGNESATTEGGEVITTADGQAVTERAHTNWVEATTLYEEAERSGWNPRRCEAVAGKFDAAISAQRGSFPEAQYMAGLTAEACGDSGEARTFYERALQANGEMCEARVALGLLDLSAGDRTAAREAFTKAIADNPTTCSSGYVNLAALQQQDGSDAEEEALRNLRRALAIESENLPAFNTMALLYYEQGIRSRRNRSSLDLAEIVCRQAQLLQRDYAPIYNTWGLVKMARGNVIEALRFFERAIELDENMFEAQMNFGQITLSFRGYEDARAAFAKATELRPNDYMAHLGLGAALRGLERFPEAKAEYEKAIELDGDRAEAYYNLGILHGDYLSATVEDPRVEWRMAQRFYADFLERARGKDEFEAKITGLERRCSERRRRRSSSSCQNGRLQNLEQFIEAMDESEQIQAEADAMQREMEQQQPQQQQQQQQAPSEGESPSE
ncbi:MAG: tetratricopeptide repeat protein [Myxococcota bacterium]